MNKNFKIYYNNEMKIIIILLSLIVSVTYMASLHKSNNVSFTQYQEVHKNNISKINSQYSSLEQKIVFKQSSVKRKSSPAKTLVTNDHIDIAIKGFTRILNQQEGIESEVNWESIYQDWYYGLKDKLVEIYQDESIANIKLLKFIDVYSGYQRTLDHMMAERDKLLFDEENNIVRKNFAKYNTRFQKLFDKRAKIFEGNLELIFDKNLTTVKRYTKNFNRELNARRPDENSMLGIGL